MNIWILNHYAVPLEYYPHGRPHWFAENLVKKGHTVTVFAASSVHNSEVNLINDSRLYKTEKKNGVEYVYLKTTSYKGNGIDRIWNMVQYATNVYRVNKIFKRPNTIVAMSVHPLACVAGIRLAKKFNIKCIVDIADLWPETFKAYGILRENNLLLKLLYRGEYWIYKKADAIIFTMEGGRDYIRNKKWDIDSGGAINLSKVFHINNGIDLDAFDKNAKEFPCVDEDLNNPELFKIVYMGSIRAGNNVNVLIKAAGKLTDYKKIKFLIFGGGLGADKLMQTIRESKLENIKYKGMLCKKDVPAVLKKSDLNLRHHKPISIFKFGTSQNKEFEYLAAGKPILSTINAGYSLVEKGQCGIELKEKNISAITKACIEMLHLSEDERLKMGKKARKLAEKYDFKILTDQLEHIIQRVNGE